MARVLILDSDPAGLTCFKPGNLEADKFRTWLFGQLGHSAILVIPEIVDYEVRRSLIFAEARDSVRQLDGLYESERVRRLPINTASMRRAAQLWAEARRKHRPTASDQAIDGDVILAAQAMEFCSDADDWVIITENVAHIARYVGERARSRRTIVEEWLKSPTSSF